MIIKTLTRKNNSGQLIKYVLRYVTAEAKHPSSEKPFIIRHNIRGRTIAEYIKEFKMNESNRIYTRSNQIALHHTILSWSDKDSNKLSDKILLDIAKQFIRVRGDDNLYIGAIHRDRSHTHIHLAISGTALNGKANRITKARFAEIKEEMTRYQLTKYPELVHSLPAHGKNSLSKITVNQPTIDNKSTRKKALLTAIEKIQSKAKTFDQFLALLKKENIEAYYRGNEHKLTGVKISDFKCRFKTLGIDPNKLHEHFLVNEQEQVELNSLRKIRSKSKEKENIERDSFPEKELIKGFGEVSPYQAFASDQVSFTK